MKSMEVQKWQDETALDRFKIIQDLVSPDLDDAKRVHLRKKIAADNDVSVKTLRRWEKAYFERGFDGLRPKTKSGSQSSRLPGNVQEILEEAKQMKREVVTRSVDQIITLLETEGKRNGSYASISSCLRFCTEGPLISAHLHNHMPLSFRSFFFSSNSHFCSFDSHFYANKNSFFSLYQGNWRSFSNCVFLDFGRYIHGRNGSNSSNTQNAF